MSSYVNTVNLEVENRSITPVSDMEAMAETQDTQGTSSTAGKELDQTLGCDIISVEWRVL